MDAKTDAWGARATNVARGEGARMIGLAVASVGVAMGMRLITTRLSSGRGGGRRRACVND